jgi:hypothetical protein
MDIKYSFLISTLLLVSKNSFSQNNNPAFQSKNGTYYFTHNKPIELKWGDTHFFHDSVTKRRKYITDTVTNFSITSLVDSNYSNMDISVYPNPFINTINIKYIKDGDLQVELMDISGRYAMRKTLSGMNRELDLSGLASSTYLLRVYDSKFQLLQTFKIEKEQ